ncbi:MAG: hypothetical protein HY606_07315 [Planctomycetes bacterium]|nr:hypothetical protein [Planctomycetota bacterium]
MKLLKPVLLFCFCDILIGFCYIDPGTGSYIFQLLIAGVVGTLYAIKLYWKKIKLLFNRSKTSGQTDGERNKQS